MLFSVVGALAVAFVFWLLLEGLQRGLWARISPHRAGPGDEPVIESFESSDSPATARAYAIAALQLHARPRSRA